jgi:hypothetical protein
MGQAWPVFAAIRRVFVAKIAKRDVEFAQIMPT